VQTITLVLQAFKERGGFDVVNHILESYASEIKSKGPLTAESSDETFGLECAHLSMKDILSLYVQICTGKNVTESIQTLSMTNNRSKPDYFSPPQFLVELRMAILPVIRRLWESELVEKAPSDISEKLIEVIRTIANADSEANALKRSDKVNPVIKGPRKTFKINSDQLTNLVDHGFDTDLANEALYRCNNHFTLALEYCNEVSHRNGQRYPIPDGDIAPETPSTSRPRTSTSTGTATPDVVSPDSPMPASDPVVSVPAIIDALSQSMPPPPVPGSGPVTPQNFDLLLNRLSPGHEDQSNNASTPSSSVPRASPAVPSSVVPENQVKQVTVDDLNEERAAIRENLMVQSLDAINAHNDINFEISDLITTVVNKSPDPSAQRKSVGETLVIALMSFAGEEDVRTSGKKVAAYAHLLALMLRDKLFYAAAVGLLKDNLSTLLGFVKLSPSHSSDGSSPWIAHVLLIVEMLLSEDSKPRKTKWSSPKDENDAIESPVLEPFDPAVPSDERAQLLEAILEILPRIGKSESLALAVLRILVILTRTRSVAQVVGEKKNIQRLFVMAKQLAGPSTAQIQSPLMLILRHIIEDEETIKQIMRSETKSFFEANRQQRTIDPSLYLRGLASTAIRAPDLFVEVTNEMVKYSRWSYPSADSSSRSNSLALKDPFAPGSDPAVLAAKSADGSVQPTVQATEDLTLQDVKPSTEEVDTEMQDAAKVVPLEHKLPVVDNPDGVIHFLLCELLNYRDVEDKEPAPALTGTSDKIAAVPNGDTPMSGFSPDVEALSPPAEIKPPKSSKQELKHEEHPIYTYRLFILQCLTELLGSYNRTKIEFINFKRSAPQQAMTPSKPRSSVVNYLLSDLIPTGFLDKPDSVASQKKYITSNWADSVITALLTKTGEQLIDKNREPSDGEDEPDLLFVRKFVLENILKAYKEASASNESLEIKYARMFYLAELMTHIMSGKENSSIGSPETSITSRSQQQLRRIMFEKGFIGALTTSIADVDLNFPGAKRAVKYILKPLRTLTTTAIQLSDLSLISSTLGQNEDDEIESATSVSEGEDEREETPDLFRNSTLGMFEPGREEDSLSESEDGKFFFASLEDIF